MRKEPYSNLYIKRRILKLKIDIIQKITQGIRLRIPKAKIMKEIQSWILSLSVQLGLSDLERNRLSLDAENEYNRITRKSYAQIRWLRRRAGSGTELDPEAVNRIAYTNIRARIKANDLIKEANSVMYEYEFRTKHDEIYGREGMLAQATTSPFFLCSSHPNPAKGHADWEGKMYYDADWESKGTYSDSEKASIRAYIRNRKLHTVQWVVGEPVYLVTRRNCKHYLMNIPLSEVLHSSPKSLLRKHKMYMKDEEPASQEILTYREYYNRLKIEEALEEVIPNQLLKQDVVNDKKLLYKRKNKL